MPFTTFARPEFIADISIPSASAFNTVQTLPSQGGQLPSDRFIAGLVLQFEGRATMPAAGGPTGVLADAPFSLFDRIQVKGYHRIRKQDELFFDLRGADLRELVRLYIANAPFFTNSINGGAAGTTLSVAANATNDMRYMLLVPFTPLRMPIQSQLGWLLDAPNYDRLILSLKIGDSLSLFSGGAPATVVWTAFGSGAGSPRARVHGFFSLGGPRQFGGFVPGRIWRYFSETVGSTMTTTATRQRIVDIPRGNRLRALLLKSGVKATVTAGNDAYSTLSDTILANLEINQGTNKIIRSYTDFFGPQFEHSAFQQIQPNPGFALIDFAKAGILGESLDVRSLVSGPTGNVDLFLRADVTGAANQAVVVCYEELRGAPGSIAAVRR